ncbi:MAG: cob(I)yrinic acid a,c-diamide adenosyltransferase [Armatimonadetes bacterium]|nr:cob(I)yrinic acid a,c-diamide adenosyltransferase [Armatimonadota bacterium]
MRINRVVTRVGDRGETALVGGSFVSKASPRVAAYGDVDELNSWLGLTVCHLQDRPIAELLEEIQHGLFTLGADLASPAGVEVPRIEKQHVLRLEAMMESIMDELPPLEEFILPGGGPGGASLHVARTVCRRAERTTVALAADADVNPEAIIYLNRLSDLLFVMARVANRREGKPETLAVFSQRKTRRRNRSPTA